MNVEDYAKTASRTAVMANVCPRFFKVNIEQMRQWRRIAIEVGEQLSEEFDAICLRPSRRVVFAGRDSWPAHRTDGVDDLRTATPVGP
jgi:hypothetical protein